MYLTTQKSQGCWLVSTIKLHRDFSTIIPLIREDEGTINRWIYIYEVEPDGNPPRPMKKHDVERMSGLRYN